jgi:hypothetical protein
VRAIYVAQAKIPRGRRLCNALVPSFVATQARTGLFAKSANPTGAELETIAKYSVVTICKTLTICGWRCSRAAAD